jgi:hypothetical protein
MVGIGPLQKGMHRHEYRCFRAYLQTFAPVAGRNPLRAAPLAPDEAEG